MGRASASALHHCQWFVWSLRLVNERPASSRMTKDAACGKIGGDSALWFDQRYPPGKFVGTFFPVPKDWRTDMKFSRLPLGLALASAVTASAAFAEGMRQPGSTVAYMEYESYYQPMGEKSPSDKMAPPAPVPSAMAPMGEAAPAAPAPAAA